MGAINWQLTASGKNLKYLDEVPIPLRILDFDGLTRDSKRHQDDEHDDTEVHHVNDLDGIQS